MHDFKFETLIEDLLDAEKSAILSGDFRMINKIAEQKEKLFEENTSRSVNKLSSISKIREKSKHNQRLLAAYMLGIRAAIKRISELQSGATGLNIYSNQGVCEQLTQHHQVKTLKHI